MGVPGVGIESSFRNPEDEVARFFQLRHKGHFMIYNLACEKSYDYAKFDDQVIAIGWPDHHAPPLHILFQLCQSLHSWLGADPKNVAAVHCKAGKVRFGSDLTILDGLSTFLTPDDHDHDHDWPETGRRP